MEIVTVGKKKGEINAINFILYLKNLINMPKGKTDVETTMKTTQCMPANLTYLFYYLHLLIILSWLDHRVKTCVSFWSLNILLRCFYVLSSHLAEITASQVLFSLKGLFRTLSIELHIKRSPPLTPGFHKKKRTNKQNKRRGFKINKMFAVERIKEGLVWMKWCVFWGG